MGISVHIIAHPDPQLGPVLHNILPHRLWFVFAVTGAKSDAGQGCLPRRMSISGYRGPAGDEQKSQENKNQVFVSHNKERDLGWCINEF
jgi:hypothetical protein